MKTIKKDDGAMRLSELLVGIVDAPTPSDCEITGIASDSRGVRPGFLFAAFEGDTTSGAAFIPQAIENGAVAIISDQQPGALTTDVPIIFEKNIREKLGFIASRFFGDPSKSMQLVGVTGTNGKTSITHFIAQAMSLVDQPTALVGTLGAGLFGDVQDGKFTTPQVINVHQTLSTLRDQGAKTIAMEVSSHGLVQQRVTGVEFDIAVFTNLTHDHLDYHGDMDAYWLAKRRLFAWPSLKSVIINIDDRYGESLARELANELKVYTCSLSDKVVAGCEAINVTKLTQSVKGISAHVTTPWGDGVLKSHLMGRFNISNLLAAMCVLSINAISFEESLRILSRLDTVPGRMQSIRAKGQPLVVVDYAHTPDALEHALMALRPHSAGKLWCVFGCGGGRDRDKRKIMGQIAERFSDQLIITNDNPRGDDPKEIVADILKGLLCSWAAEIELDRGAAIAHAIDCATQGDIVLIAGKGHEQYQEFATERIPFNDVEHVESHIKNLRDKI